MTASQIRTKARDLCRDATAAAEAGRMPFDVTHRPGWHTQTAGDGSTTVPLACSSCKNPAACTWEGAASYRPKTAQFKLRCIGQRDPSGQRKKGGAVTPAQRAVLDSSLSKTAFGRILALNRSEDSPPDKTQEQNRLRNKSRRVNSANKTQLKRALKFEEDDRSVFTVDDITDAIHAAGAVWRADLPLKEAVSGAFADESLDPDALLVLSFHTFERKSGKLGCCAVVSAKELMQVPPRLGNPNFLKVGIDATFKDIFGDWKLMPLGVLSKHLAVTTVDEGIRAKAWSTHCTPVLYCVANSDGAAAAEYLLHAFDHVPLTKLGSLSVAEASKTCPRRDENDDGHKAAMAIKLRSLCPRVPTSVNFMPIGRKASRQLAENSAQIPSARATSGIASKKSKRSCPAKFSRVGHGGSKSSSWSSNRCSRPARIARLCQNSIFSGRSSSNNLRQKGRWTLCSI